MDKNAIEYTFRLVNPDEFLLWLMFLTGIGLIVTGVLMMMTSRFFIYRKDTGIVRFSIMDLELPRSYTKFKTLLSGIPDSTKDAVRTSLKLDNYFMPCLYLFLFFYSLYTLWFYYRCGRSGSCWFLVLPFVCWILDVAENKLIASSLLGVTKPKTNALLAVSSAKWIIALLYFGVTTYYLVTINRSC